MFNTKRFRMMVQCFARKFFPGSLTKPKDIYFEIQISNEDPTSGAGRQTMILIDCNIDGGILAKFDADGEYLDEDMDFTFEDFKMPEAFKDLDGFLTN